MYSGPVHSLLYLARTGAEAGAGAGARCRGLCACNCPIGNGNGEILGISFTAREGGFFGYSKVAGSSKGEECDSSVAGRWCLVFLAVGGEGFSPKEKFRDKGVREETWCSV